jgi:hypothetical protein
MRKREGRRERKRERENGTRQTKKDRTKVRMNKERTRCGVCTFQSHIVNIHF